MNNIRTWLLYSLYITGSVLFFIYYLFPSDTIEKYIIAKVSEKNPELTVTIDKIKPAFPPGLKLHEVNVSRETDTLIEIQEIKLMPSLFSLFGSQVRFSFNGEMCQGSIEGDGVIAKDSKSPDIQINANLEDIQVKDIHAINMKPEYKISGGILGGTLSYDTNSSEKQGTAALKISECMFEILSPLKLGNFNFSHIDADMVLDDKKKLLINQGTLKGQQINGDISGFVLLRSPYAGSVLNLTINIKPHPSFIATLGKVFPAALLFKKAGENGLPLKITGTVEKPKYSLR